jgi:predicted nuclease with TOPRIM domain
MKHPHLIRALAILIIAGLVTTPVMAQKTAQERAASLRQQLAEVQAKQTELETRLQQLEEDLKPENIEKRLAGVGSTRPEELREQRRRQLEIEKKSVQTRLDQLTTSRTRLETGIVQADVAAYHSSAGPNAGETDKETTTKQPTSAQPASVTSPTVQRRARRGNRNKPRPRRIRRAD